MKIKVKDLEKSPRKNLYLLGLSVLVGLSAGFLASMYRLTLQEAEVLGRFLYGKVAAQPLFILILIPALALLAWIVTYFLKKWPMSAGSGIPQVKGQLQGFFKPNWLTTAYAKFVAGSLAMFAGLSLGREGPSIQLGASMGQAVGEKFAETERQRRILTAAGASAGLTAAFNAPLSGVMFTLEEIFKYFSPLILLTCMTSAVVADSVTRLIFGGAAIFNFQITGSIALGNYWMLAILGVILGLFGSLYNWTLLQGQKWMKQVPSSFGRLAISFATAGLLGLIFPIVIGSGHSLIDSLSLSWGLGFLLLIFVVKYFISMISYVSGVPGGIFFPLLVLGASLGAVFASICINFFHLPATLFANVVILAMAGTFTAIVRAPMTGILLLVEMTGSFSHLLPLALVSLIAYVIAELLNSKPIYDSLLNKMLAEKSPDPADTGAEMFFETIIQFDSKADGRLLSQLELPEGCLLVSIHRSGENLIPRGKTQLSAGDYLTFLIKRQDEFVARQQIRQLLSEE